MAYASTNLRCSSTRAFACALSLAAALLATGNVCAQEPAPETAPSPPPSDWGGSTSSTAQPSETYHSSASASGSHAAEPDTLKDASHKLRPQMVSVFTGFQFGHFAGYGFPMMIGGRYYIPIVGDGFLPTINDEFGLEFGLDLNFTFLSDRYADSVLFGFGIPTDAVWDFHFSPKFDAYAKVGWIFGSAFNSGYGGFWWDFRTHVGMRLKLNELMYFRAEVGYPTIMAGLGFAL